MMKDKIIKYLTYFITFCLLVVILCNCIVIFSSNNRIDIDYNDYDAIIVLGCKIVGDKPTRYLEERLKTTIEVYNKTELPVIISGSDEEVYIMRDYLIDGGVPGEIITIDNKGVKTYNSFKNLEIFDFKKIIIITQKYHLYRSIYLCEFFDYECVGVSAYLPGNLFTTMKNYCREYLSRTKVVFQLMFV